MTRGKPITAETHKRIVKLLGVSGINQKQIAATLEVSESTVSRISVKGRNSSRKRREGVPENAEVDLWGKVILRAVNDAKTIRSAAGRDIDDVAAEWSMSRNHAIKKLRRARGVDERLDARTVVPNASGCTPREFFESLWFRDVCHFINAEPGKILAGIEQVALAK